jgi:hypothetical protein
VPASEMFIVPAAASHAGIQSVAEKAPVMYMQRNGSMDMRQAPVRSDTLSRGMLVVS